MITPRAKRRLGTFLAMRQCYSCSLIWYTIVVYDRSVYLDYSNVVSGPCGLWSLATDVLEPGYNLQVQGRSIIQGFWPFGDGRSGSCLTQFFPKAKRSTLGPRALERCNRSLNLATPLQVFFAVHYLGGSLLELQYFLPRSPELLCRLPHSDEHV